MKNVKLNNKVEMPMEGFGVFQVSEDQCEQVVLDAIEMCYRLLDTASSYKNGEAVGSAALKAINAGMVKREDLFITTKAYMQQMGYEKTVQAFYESLNRLGLDYLDLYLIHMPLGDYYGAWRAMEDLYEAGKIRAIGGCNFDGARRMDLCYNARIRPMVNVMPYCASYYEKLCRYINFENCGMVLGTGCGTPEMTKESVHT